MIGRLTGTLVEKTPTSIILDVNGVGYEVYAPEPWKTTAVLNTAYALSIYTHVRDDAIELFGFSTLHERKLFELLLSVSGVGPKTALVITSHGVGEVEQAITTANVDFFTNIPRIGKKNAQRE